VVRLTQLLWPLQRTLVSVMFPLVRISTDALLHGRRSRGLAWGTLTEISRYRAGI
jgi:hypothetical protein